MPIRVVGALVAVLAALLVALPGCSSEPVANPVAGAERRVGSDLTAQQFALRTDSRHFRIRAGESIVVPVSLFSAGEYGGPLLPDLDASGLAEGITVSGFPDIVDLGGDNSPAFYVVITAGVSTPVGPGGYAAIRFSDPDDVDNQADSEEGLTLDVVGPGTTIGPVAGIDFVVSDGAPTAFATISTDVAGDAPLDLTTLAVVDEPTIGSLTVSDDGTFVYSPNLPGGD